MMKKLGHSVFKVPPDQRDYSTRLRIIKKLALLIESRRVHGFNTSHVEAKIKQYHPETVFLDTEEGIARVADAIAHDHPVVTDYGATYGTAFSTNIREQIALARQEQEPLAVVSLVCSKRDAHAWMNKNRLHPDIVTAIDAGSLDIIAGVAFIRFPCTDEAVKQLGAHYVNHDQEVQVFMVENDPLMDYLYTHYNIPYIAVRSSNINGKPEEPFATGAELYASEIGAPIFAIRSREAYQAQLDDDKAIASSTELTDSLHRKRVGSQPILVLKTNNHGAVVELVRAGNTTPETMQRLLKDFLGDSIRFEYKEEKKAAHVRKMFHVSKEITDPKAIRAELLKASLL